MPASSGATCSPAAPDFSKGANDALGIDPAKGGDLTLAVAARDPSMTLIGFCTVTGALPAHAPSLQDGAVELLPGGGFKEDGEGISRIFFIYGSTAGTSLEVRQQDDVLGHVRFGPPPSNACAPTTPSQAVVACGVLTVVEMDVQLAAGITAASIVGVDGLVEDGKAGGTGLGFYFFGATDSPGGVRIRIGFQRPASTTVFVTLREAYRETGAIDLTGNSRTIDVSLGHS